MEAAPQALPIRGFTVLDLWLICAFTFLWIKTFNLQNMHGILIYFFMVGSFWLQDIEHVIVSWSFPKISINLSVYIEDAAFFQQEPGN